MLLPAATPPAPNSTAAGASTSASSVNITQQVFLYTRPRWREDASSCSSSPAAAAAGSPAPSACASHVAEPLGRETQVSQRSTQHGECLLECWSGKSELSGRESCCARSLIASGVRRRGDRTKVVSKSRVLKPPHSSKHGCYKAVCTERRMAVAATRGVCCLPAHLLRVCHACLRVRLPCLSMCPPTATDICSSAADRGGLHGHHIDTRGDAATRLCAKTTLVRFHRVSGWGAGVGGVGLGQWMVSGWH